MKIMKKTIGIILALCIAFSLMTPAFAGYYFNEKATDYPFVLVHGMMGWGENTYSKNGQGYWGMMGDLDIAGYLREKGYTVAVPSVGPISSAWDRACEMFAELTGTVVDYGAAHSAQCGHERYGRDYTGKGMLDSDWYKTGRINLISHSFGGPAIRVFSSLMAYGDEAEKKASPDDCSPLFSGEYPESIYSVTTLQSPHNGTPTANLVSDLGVPAFIFALVCHIQSLDEDPVTDYMLDQWGLTADPSTGEKASFNLSGLINIVKSKDNCAYDMSLQGAKKTCEKFRINENAYHFSYSANMMKKSVGSIVVPDNSPMMAATGILNAALAGGIYGGILTDRSWAYNDGLVPVPSAQYPQGQPYVDYRENMILDKGIWHVMPTGEGSHGYGVNGTGLQEFWDNLIFVLDSTMIPEPARGCEIPTEEERKAAKIQQALYYYNDAIEKACNSVPGLTKERYADNETVNLSAALTPFEKIIRQFADIGEENKRTDNYEKGEWPENEMASPLKKSTLTPDDIDEATYGVEEGCTVITLYIKSGTSKGSKREKFTDAPVDKCGICVGNEDKGYYDHKTGEIIYNVISEVYDGAVVNESYENAKAVAKIETSTGNLVSLTVEYDTEVSANIIIGSGKITGTNHVIYKDFVYDTPEQNIEE